jgi:hypothetical protein
MFQHQLVYDPRSKTRKPLNPFCAENEELAKVRQFEALRALDISTFHVEVSLTFFFFVFCSNSLAQTKVMTQKLSKPWQRVALTPRPASGCREIR